MKKVLYIVLLLLSAGIGVFCYVYNNGGFKQTNNNNSKDVANIDVNTNRHKDDDFVIEDFVLFKGMEISRKTGIQEVSEMEITDENNKRYNIKYYNYENSEFTGETEGTFGNEVYEGHSIVENVGTIAMSQKYDLFPRNFTIITETPKELEENGGYPDVSINEIDLDGDGVNEHILCYQVDYSGSEEGAEPEAFSGIMLFDENYEKIADLVSLKNGFIEDENGETKVFLSLEDVQYMDIDSDGIMEIIIDVPTYEGAMVSIVKYSNGEIDGETNVEASILP